MQECAPWIPEQGTLDVKIWKKLGDAMHVHHSLCGNERVPANAFVLWNLFRECLDPRHESEQLRRRVRSLNEMSEKEPLLTASVKKYTEETQSESESESDDDEDGKK